MEIKKPEFLDPQKKAKEEVIGRLVAREAGEPGSTDTPKHSADIAMLDKINQPPKERLDRKREAMETLAAEQLRLENALEQAIAQGKTRDDEALAGVRARLLQVQHLQVQGMIDIENKGKK